MFVLHTVSGVFCTFKEKTYRPGDSWHPYLEPFGFMFCMRCTCTEVHIQLPSLKVFICMVCFFVVVVFFFTGDHSWIHIGFNVAIFLYSHFCMHIGTCTCQIHILCVICQCFCLLSCGCTYSLVMWNATASNALFCDVKIQWLTHSSVALVVQVKHHAFPGPIVYVNWYEWF